MAELGISGELNGSWTPPATLDEARALARARFKARLVAGEEVGGCGCGDEDAVIGRDDGSTSECVVGVRFRDSGRVYYFKPGQEELTSGDWVAVSTSRGEEAGQVVLAPHQVRRSLLQGDLASIARRLTERDIDSMEAFRRAAGEAVRLFGERARARRLAIKPISAVYAFDGRSITLNYSVPDRERAPDAAALTAFATELASSLASRVELHQVGPRDEARLLGGLGRCGRTLCCSSWLPVFPEISMSMAKNQDLPLNPSKVSGVCGRLLCCLSYENDQYRQMKAVMPKLGQTIETPGGAGLVVSMHLLKELVTVRLDEEEREVTFRCDELGLGSRQSQPIAQPVRQRDAEPTPAQSERGPAVEDQPIVENLDASGGRRRRRRRGGRRGASSA
jgi:cell fate regulator YaaT (PSP1 superfamily)